MTVRSIGAPSPVEVFTAVAGWRTLARSVSIPLVQAAGIGSLLYLLLEGWHRDVTVPLGLSSDSLWFLMQSKSTVDNGWWWWNPRLGAPFGLDEVSYPSNSNVDQALVWLVSRAVAHPMAAVNLTWAILVILSGLTATWCMRQLKVSAWSAFAGGTLFALSPYALYRHIDHFSLVIYLVPFACAAGLRLAAGQPHQSWSRMARWGILAGCMLLGFNYIYYAFFACYCIAAGAVVGYVAHRNRRLLTSGALCLAVIGSATAVNLAPSLYSWTVHGRPALLRDKVPAEAETFGLKIRQLVSPVFPNRIAPLQSWVQREAAARFPNENENWTSRLGLVGTIGFLGLLCLLFVPDGAARGAAPIARAASRVMLALLLLATVGGFGSLFNLLVTPDIRAYNRVVPFVAFLSLLAVFAGVERLFRARRARIAATVGLLVVGLSDQGQAAQRLNDQHAPIAAEMAGLESVVQRIERALPAGAMVYQLPFRVYMSETDLGRMKRYDHFKPYLVSQTLRFSYPALSNEQMRWQQAAFRLDIAGLARALATAGFSAVLVDRWGYQDNGDAVTAALLRIAGTERAIVSTDRFVAVDISTITGKPAGAAGEAALLPVPLTLSLPPCAGAPMMVLDQIGPHRAPFDRAGVRIRRRGDLRVSGWAVDHPRRAAAAGVDIAIDRAIFPALYGAARRDVAEYFQRPDYESTGFTASIPAGAVAAGEHGLSVRVVSSDGSCYTQSASILVTVQP